MEHTLSNPLSTIHQNLHIISCLCIYLNFGSFVHSHDLFSFKAVSCSISVIRFWLLFGPHFVDFLCFCRNQFHDMIHFPSGLAKHFKECFFFLHNVFIFVSVDFSILSAKMCSILLACFSFLTAIGDFTNFQNSLLEITYSTNQFRCFFSSMCSVTKLLEFFVS